MSDKFKYLLEGAAGAALAFALLLVCIVDFALTKFSSTRGALARGASVSARKTMSS